MKVIPLLLSLLVYNPISIESKNPVIAILSTPYPSNERPIKVSKIKTDYVQWINASGGIAVAIHPWQSKEEIEAVLDKVNGVLFQGGSVHLNLQDIYTQAGKIIFDKVKSLHDEGQSIPLWGTCLGFELLMGLTSGKEEILDILSSYDAQQHLKNLELVEDSILKESQMFKYFTDEDLRNIQNFDIINEQHKFGVSPETYDSTPLMNEFFKVTSYSRDRNNSKYIATVEGRKYPIYGTQFHSEKTVFDMTTTDAVAGSLPAKLVNRAFGNFFVEKARERKVYSNDFTGLEIVDLLISLPINTEEGDSYFLFQN